MSHTGEYQSSLRSLAALGKRGGLEMQPVLLRVLTDLFVSRDIHGREETRQFEAIAFGLIGKADLSTRLIVAGKLARCGATPQSVVDRMIEGGGSPAVEFLRHSSLVRRSLLLAGALHGDTEIAEAIAGRLDLDAEMARALAERPEIVVARALAANLAAPIIDDFAPRLVERGRRDRRLGQALCRRLSNTAMIAPLFLYASPRQRADILMAARRADLGNLTRAPRKPDEQSNIEELERAAIAQDRPLLAAILARLLGASLAEAIDILADPRGEPMALALASLRASPEAAARIFMCLDPIIAHSHERVRALSELVVDVSPAAARDIVNGMLEKPEEEFRPARAADMARGAETPSRELNNAREAARPRASGLLLLRRRA